MNDADDLPPPIPAATLILMRERTSGSPDILVTERHAGLAFAGGALVFPGGRIDPEDETAGAAFPELPDAAARIAAIRETIEETGIIPAVAPHPSPERAAALRVDLIEGLGWEGLLARKDVVPDLTALTPFARWRPNFREARRFDTLFFIAEATGDLPEPTIAEAEAVRAFWASAAEILDEIEAGKARAIFPTRRNLERLARFGSITEARADAERHPVQLITPWIEDRGGARFVCIPEGIGYPVTAEPLETARRR